MRAQAPAFLWFSFPLKMHFFVSGEGETHYSTTARHGKNLGHQKYFMGTNYIDVNYCCGPVEMQDKDKRQLPLLRPQINLPSAYPPSYSLTNAQAFILRYRNRQAVALDGLLAPFPLLPREGLEVDLPKFNIENYFKLEPPGEYQLTVWPKIYQRSATNSDLCERIDLPPVTIPIQWTGGAKN